MHTGIDPPVSYDNLSFRWYDGCCRAYDNGGEAGTLFASASLDPVSGVWTQV